MPRTLQSLAELLAARLIGGDPESEVSRVASLRSACPGDLVFVESEKYLEDALRCDATAVIAGGFASAETGHKPLLIVKDPRLAFARAGLLLNADRTFDGGVHASAVVDPSAQIAPTANIGPYSIIEANARVGARTWIGAACHIGVGVVLGDDCEMYPRVVIYTATLGQRVTVHAGAVLGSDGFGFVRDTTTGHYVKFPQAGRLIIGDDVEIGANCTIDRGALDETVIGSGTKLDNLVHVGHNVSIGKNVVIAAQTGISGSVTIEDDCIIGGQVGIGDHVRIEAGAILGSQCGVLPNQAIRGRGVVFWGTPARPVRQCLRELAVLSRLAKKGGK